MPADSEAEEVVDSTVVVVEAARQAAAPAGRRKDMTGVVLNHKFELTSFIGSGGMSEVYKAKHKVTGKSFAVKVLHENCSAEETTILRLKQEAQAAGALSHPNILGIHDFGIDEAGMPYLVMDFIDGDSFSSRIKAEGVLQLDRFMKLMVQVAAALRHAQEQNVVHRDLKPSNIMIMKLGDAEQVKIVDFGIAKILAHDEGTLQQLTKTGETFGSPLYMSPEQCMGALVDSRSDIYSFGCVMYEALCGRPPHVGETVFDTIHRHINNPPPPLSAPQVDSKTSKRLEALILRCLAKDPKDRYQQFAQIESELKKIETSTGAGAVHYVENAWNLVQAKQASRKKSRTPLLIFTLVLLSCISICSSICLVVTEAQLERAHKRFRNSSLAQIKHLDAYIYSTRIYKAGQNYLRSRDPEVLAELEKYKGELDRSMQEAEQVMRDEPEIIEHYREFHGSLTTGLKLFKDAIGVVPKGAELSLFSQAPKLRQIVRYAQQTQDQLVNLQKEEDKKLERLAARVSQMELTVSSLGYLTLFLNSAVIGTLLIYFIRHTRQLQKQKEQILTGALEQAESK